MLGGQPYFREYDNMTIVAVTTTLEGAHLLECYLIERFLDRYKNEHMTANDLGGTGRSKACPTSGSFYIYILNLRADIRPDYSVARAIRERPFLITDADLEAAQAVPRAS